MSDLPESLGVLTFNPITNRDALNILKEYFKCMPYTLYVLDGAVYYIVPHTKTINVVLNKIYDYFEDYLNIDIFRSTIYKYNSRLRTYYIINDVWHKNILPSYIRVSELNIEKLESFLED